MNCRILRQVVTDDTTFYVWIADLWRAQIRGQGNSICSNRDEFLFVKRLTIGKPRAKVVLMMLRFSLLAAVAFMACGPTQSTSYLMDTQNMLEAARTAQAERLAPYEWTKANLFYEKSKEEVGYSDFEQAVSFAKSALDYATKARNAAVKLVQEKTNTGDAPAEIQVVKP
jgi:Domain of unknown function (DUF4398)